MYIEQKPSKIYIYQKKYIDSIIEKYEFKDSIVAKTPLNKNIKLAKQKNYKANPSIIKECKLKVSSLNFAANQTRPDISFPIEYIARYYLNPN